MIFRTFTRTTTFQIHSQGSEPEDTDIESGNIIIPSKADPGNSDMWYVPFLVGTETDSENHLDAGKGNKIMFGCNNGKD